MDTIELTRRRTRHVRELLARWLSPGTRLSTAVDVLLVAPVSSAGLVMSAARRLGLPHRFPRTTAALDRIGIYPSRHHFYEPLVRPADLRRPLSDVRTLPGLDLDVAGQLAFLERLRFGAELLALPDTPTEPGVFTYANEQFGPGDAELLYSMIRELRPARIIEIGSGNSSLVAKLAIEANISSDPAYGCDQCCIEPYAAEWLEASIEHVVRSPVERLDVRMFDELAADDMLFIDSTHVIRPQGDVLFEYLEVIGRLRRGVYVHVHDVFTPRDYPSRWVLGERKLWNEQYLLEALLCHSDRFEVVIALNHLWHEHPAAVTAALPVLGRHPHAEPGSFWFRVR